MLNKVFLFSALMSAVFPVNAELSKTMVHQVIEDYRKTIVLLSKDIEQQHANPEKTAVVGKIIFHQNQNRLNKIEKYLTTDIEANSRQIETLLDILENDNELWDADKLVFLGLLESLADQVEGIGNKYKHLNKLSKRLKNDVQTLEQIQANYDHELGDIFSQLETRAIKNRRQAWSEYIDFLRQKYSKQQIINQYSTSPLLPESRGTTKKKNKNEIFGYELPEKTIVLTFDDGPHYKYTEKIFDTLKTYDIKPIFFHVGENLGKYDDKGNIKLLRSANISKKLVEYGAVLANHSYSHPLLTKLSDRNLENEIADTNKLLKQITGQETGLFRPPYGARNEFVQAKVKSLNLASVMWNVDSKDWADPVPKSIAERVLADVEKKKRGILLFHDIQPQTVKAIPLIIEELIKRDYQFAQWDGEKFSLAATKSTSPTKQKSRSLYRESWGVVIGIDNYKHWPKLNYAVNDAKEIKNLLTDKLGFKKEKVFTLYNEQATTQNILSLLNDKLGNLQLVKKNDRVFIFYAGHGATRKLASGRELGYIIPIDAKTSGYYGQSISMTNLSDISEGIAAKHIFFVMDSCYSGLALTRSGVRTPSVNFLLENSKRVARQILTAGGADQEVADSGPNGHSVFTWNLIQALTDKGDMNNDGYITASELAAYISPVVSSVSLQTPTFGNLLGSGGGDFIFELNMDDRLLSNLSEQLDSEELSLAKQIEALKKEIEAKRKRNITLKQELAAYKKELAAEDGSETIAGKNYRQDPEKLNARGLHFYRQKNYPQALDYFKQAAHADPTYVEAINNVGFIYQRTKRNEEAIIWFLKTVALDPERSVVWLNLGDAYFETGKYILAEQAYKKYLEMVPNSKVAAKVKNNIHYIHKQVK